MLELAFISIHPEFIEAYRGFGVFASAEKQNLAKVHVQNLRDSATDRHKSVDDRPYGGGDGMILRADILANSIQSLPYQQKPRVIFTAPTGKLFKQDDAERLIAQERPLAFICGRFGGCDQRFIDQYVDEEFSLGDFVISGGELPCLTIADSMLRLIPGVLGHKESAVNDSFGQAMKNRLEGPQYTRPAIFEGQGVPEVLTSGNHKKIEDWRSKQSQTLTQIRRPDLET
ncbi:MAG: tRNA (guanosine(37)-N1)-methyltransferase TrmD [Oligoflexales bacterium]|nr:tRNA (guanosine(37)-N1)-methyltransferase TrmD [Oligoflexales bacterium]